VQTIKRYVSSMLCIFPFEEPFYAQEGVSARYVGNPSVEQLGPPPTKEQARQFIGIDASRPVLALLPGSRMGEIRRIFPAMLEAARELVAKHPGMQVVVPVAPTIDAAVIRAEAARHQVVPVLVEGQAPQVVAASDAAVVASGTAVLEAALMQRPLVVVYRVSQLTYWIARLLVRVAHVAIVNLLAGREVVPELIQGAMRPERIVVEVQRLLGDPAARDQRLRDLAEVRAQLGDSPASARAADEVVRLLQRR
jgi:lipid-A-disaccharide synthase